MPIGVFPQAGDVFGREGGGGGGGGGEDAEYVRGQVGVLLGEGGLNERGAFGAVVLEERWRAEEEMRRKVESEGAGEVVERRKRREGRRLGDGVDGRGFVAPEFAHLLKGTGGRK